MFNYWPSADEFLVNKATAGDQQLASVTRLKSGKFAVAWTGPDAGGNGVYAAIYDENGTKIVNDWLVSDDQQTRSQSTPSIATLDDGGFIVVAQQQGLSSWSIKAEVYAADYSVVKPWFDVASMSTSVNLGSGVFRPDAAGLAGGGYVIVWEAIGAASTVQFQITAANGNVTSGSTAASGAAYEPLPAIAALGSGFVVTWTEADASGAGVKAQIFSAAGTGGTPFAVNTATAGDQSKPDVVTLASGGFVVVWQDASHVGGDASGTAIKAQLFDASGAKVGSEILVNAATAADQGEPAVTARPDGGFVVSWTDASAAVDGSGKGIMAQEFDASGNKVGFEIGVNQATAGDQSDSAIAVGAAGDLFAVWTDGGGSTDTSGLGVKGRLIGHSGSAGTALSDSLGGTAGNDQVDGGGGDDVLRYQQGGDDNIAGGGGDDSIYLGAALSTGDRIDGGAGVDRVYLQGVYAGTTLRGAVFSGIEAVMLLSGANTSFGPAPGVPSSYVLAVDDAVAVAGVPFSVDASDLAAGETLTFDGHAETDGILYVLGGAGADSIVGGSGADVLTGGAGDDLLDGGAGNDLLTGGTGNDVYVVDGAGDQVVEQPGEGRDEIRTSLGTYVLGAANVENLTYTGTGGGDLRGNAGDNVVTGGGGVDVLRLQDGGDDTAAGGGGDDAVFFGAAYTAADKVDGGAGKDVVAIQGDYSGGLTLTGESLKNVETLAVLTHGDPRFGGDSASGYHYVLTATDATVAAGTQLIVNASTLDAGESLTFDGHLDTDGSFFIYGGQGTDTLTGGAGVDVFFFGENGRYGAGDHVDGGGGNDILVLRGDYTIVMDGASMVNVETVTLMSGSDARFAPAGTPFHYVISTAQNTVAPGVVMTFNGGTLGAAETLVFDGSAETDGGAFRVFGGAANDTLTGGAGNDLIFGGLGADMLRGGAGNDTFRYQGVAESTASATDKILDFASGDRIDMSRAGHFSFIGSDAFGGHAGELRVQDTGSGNVWLVQADADGDGNADFVAQVTVGDGHALTAGDFAF